jgi:hypothetical protein
MTVDATNLNVAHPRTALVVGRRCREHERDVFAGPVADASLLADTPIMANQQLCPTRIGGSVRTHLPQCVRDRDHPHFQLCFRVVSAFASYGATSVFFAVHHPAVLRLIV